MKKRIYIILAIIISVSASFTFTMVDRQENDALTNGANRENSTKGFVSEDVVK
jgi:hypothetical protein